MCFKISNVCLISGIWPFSLWINNSHALFYRDTKFPKEASSFVTQSNLHFQTWNSVTNADLKAMACKGTSAPAPPAPQHSEVHWLSEAEQCILLSNWNMCIDSNRYLFAKILYFFLFLIFPKRETSAEIQIKDASSTVLAVAQWALTAVAAEGRPPGRRQEWYLSMKEL